MDLFVHDVIDTIQAGHGTFLPYRRERDKYHRYSGEKPKEGEQFAQSHTTDKWQSQNLDLD